MKRMFTGLLAAVILLTGLTVPAFAAETDGTDNQNITAKQNCCSCFADDDNDGVCDHRSQRKGHAFGKDCLPNFVDADSDGICDHRSLNNGRGWAHGLHRQASEDKPCPCSRGNGHTRRQENNRPETTIPDEEGSGLCDTPGKSNGYGYGRGNNNGQGKGQGRGKNK